MTERRKWCLKDVPEGKTHQPTRPHVPCVETCPQNDALTVADIQLTALREQRDALIYTLRECRDLMVNEWPAHTIDGVLDGWGMRDYTPEQLATMRAAEALLTEEI